MSKGPEEEVQGSKEDSVGTNSEGSSDSESRYQKARLGSNQCS